MGTALWEIVREFGKGLKNGIYFKFAQHCDPAYECPECDRTLRIFYKSFNQVTKGGKDE